MKLIAKLLSLLLLFILMVYVALPMPQFPQPPSDSFQSTEPADSEVVSVKRAYFTNFTREEVLKHYQEQFNNTKLFGNKILLPTYRLNYPPEDAKILIRDQTRSTFLEEIVHPMRESFFVNGFEPKVDKDDIWYKGIHYRQKITVKYNRSVSAVRVVVILITCFAIWLLAKSWRITCKDIGKLIEKLR